MKLHFKIKTREQFVDMLKLLYVKFPLVLLGIALVAIVVGFFGTKIWGNENGLSQAMGILFVATLIPWVIAIFVFGAYSLYRAMRAMYKAKQALDAGDQEAVAARKLEIHYSLPFAIPVGIGGFTPFGIALAFVLAYMIYKWGLPLYKWGDVKKILFHKEGTTWKCTLLTWVNFYFFIIASFYIVIVVSLIVAAVYLLYKLGVITAAWEGLTNMVINTMEKAGSTPANNSCFDCVFYNTLGDGACGHGYTNPVGRCVHFREK